MIRGKIFFLKEKQAFKKEGEALRLIGKPIEIAKKAKQEGITLIHIIDLDAQKGLSTNFDIYDKLTFIMNIEVEGVSDEKFIEKLLGINARIVVELPTKLNLQKWKDKKRLFVGKLSNLADISSIDLVHDVIVENADAKLITEVNRKNKRVILYSRDYEKISEKEKKLVFLVLEE